MKFEKNIAKERNSAKVIVRAVISTTVAALAIASMGVTAQAAPKPVNSGGPTPIGDVDLSLPHVLSSDLEGARSVTPCENLLSAVAPPFFVWSGEFRWISCSYWGATNTATKNYRWYVSPQSSALACAQGLGYVSNRYATWHYLGCGDSGEAEVIWGNVAAYPKMKFKSLSGLMAPLYWY